MNIQTPYKGFLIISLLVAFLCVGAWVGIVWMSFGLKSEIAETASQTAGTLEENARNQSLKTLIRDIKGQTDSLDLRFITKDGIPDFISRVEAKALTAGVKVEIGSIDLTSANDNAHLQSLRLHVSARGFWKNCIGYLALLESLPTASNVDTVSFTKSETGDSWNMALDIVAVTTP